jgi:Transposase DDE domain group 1
MSFGNDRATCPAQDYNSRKTVSAQLGIRLKSELRCAIVIGGAARVIEEMPLEYKKTFNPGEHLWQEQYQLMETADYIYRVFVTNLEDAIELLVWFYDQRAGAENLIKEANNDAGLAAHPSRPWAANCVHFQLAMLAYHLNCWLMLFPREEKTKVEDLQHTTLAVARLRFLFLAAKIWRHAGRVGISYSDHYAERGLFQRLMDRLRKIASRQEKSQPVLATALQL